MIDDLVPAASRPWLIAGALAWVTAVTVTGWAIGWVALFGLVAALFVRRQAAPAIAAVVVAASAGMFPQPLLDVGPISGELALTTGPASGPYGPWALGTLGGADVFVDLADPVGTTGDTLVISGTVTDEMTGFGGRPRQVVDVIEAEIVATDPGLYASAGAAVRRHVVGRLIGGSEARGLLAGFLVGDISGVSAVTVEAMTTAGLSHFVAVSGSNVVLFLGLVAALTLPIGIGPRRRALAGLLALPVFVVATGFEPSVLRASAMAALVLAGRLFGVALEVWQVIGLGTVVVLAYDPWLVHSVGFQLSLAATCGVVAGARWPGPASYFSRALHVTAGAQLAVAPLLLWQFGTIPLLSPLSNLAAAPLVGAATLLGMIGVAGPEFVLVPGEWLASIVIDIAHMSAGWPQIGWVGFLIVLGIVPLINRARARHPGPAAMAAALALLLILVPRGDVLDGGEVAVLDIGQGDAILVSGGDGHFALIDGGQDPSLLLFRLSDYGIRYLEVVVMTHGDADHAGGLEGLPGRVGIGEIWERTEPHRQPASDRFLALAAEFDIPVRQPEPGTRFRFGMIEIEVIGPKRRYASSNDQSIVLLLEGDARSMLLTGDIETYAQQELPQVRVDVLKVPHHGAGTSDESWLVSTGATEAIISVGPNDFGHPAAWVIEALELSGATVRRTDVEGNVIVDLAG